MTEERSVIIPFENKSITGVVQGPVSFDHLVILTHGAGSDHNTCLLATLAASLSGAGYGVLRFTCKALNIDYRTRAYGAVLNYALQQFTNLSGIIIGGRSMGSRAAVSVCDQVPPEVRRLLKGVVCLAYPLHPVLSLGGSLRDTPLLNLMVSCLFISGTKDEMADKDMLNNVISRMMCDTEVAWINNAGHSYKVKGRSEADVTQEVCTTTLAWCRKRFQVIRRGENYSASLSTGAIDRDRSPRNKRKRLR